MMRIAYAGAAKKPGLGDRRVTKKHGYQVRTGAHGAWTWRGIVSLLGTEHEELLTNDEKFNAKLSKNLEGMLFFADQLLVPDEFIGLSSDAVRIALPKSYKVRTNHG